MTPEFTNATNEQKAKWLKLCREDMAYALTEIGVPDLRIQCGIEMINRLLGDHEEWKKFKKMWNVPWDNTPVGSA